MARCKFCKKPAGRKNGGFNGWCADHTARLAKRDPEWKVRAKWVGDKVSDAVVGYAVCKLIEALLGIRFRAPPAWYVTWDKKVTRPGSRLLERLNAALDAADEKQIGAVLDDVEAWWPRVPAHHRDRLAGEDVAAPPRRAQAKSSQASRSPKTTRPDRKRPRPRSNIRNRA